MLSPSLFIFAPMEIDLLPSEKELLNIISNAAAKLQVQAYMVGGFVRDKIIGRATKDMDIVCMGDGIELAKEVAKYFDPKPPVSVFKNFGTAQVKLKADHHHKYFDNNESANNVFEIEFASARKESYQLESRKPAIIQGTLEDDQNRRDFTINALAIDLSENNYGKLIDPFNGLQHIEDGIIKTPLHPSKTFSDDPLRMLRAIRFSAQLKFNIDDETFSAIRQNAERINIISKERISDELNKIMMVDKPSAGWHLLSESNLLQFFFPQMMDLHGAENIDGKGHKDNFYHTLQVLDNICDHSNDLWLRWAALLHDIGKPATKRFENGHGFTFHGHEVVGARMVPKIFAQLKLPMNDKMKLVQKLVALHLRPISLTKENITESAIRRLLFDAGNDIDDLMLLCHADITSKNKQKVLRYRQNFELVKERMAEVEAKDHLRNWQPPVTGELIMETFHLKPGPKVGIIKDAIREAILDGEIENNFEAAFSFMLQKGKELDLQAV